MKKYTLSILSLFLLYGIVGCHKTNNPPNPANPLDYSSPVTGVWIWSGYGHYNNAPLDMFYSDTITKWSDTVIRIATSVIFGISDYDTLMHFAASAGIDSFQTPASYPIYDREILTYDSSTHSMAYSYYSSCDLCPEEGLSVKSPAYTINPDLHTQCSGIASTVTLSGTVYDTTFVRPDSMYHVTTIMSFTKINDSTIQYSPDILNIRDNTLHYRSVNTAAKTITYQTYHSFRNQNIYTSLTYNYASNTYIFEQFFLILPGNIYMKLLG